MKNIVLVIYMLIIFSTISMNLNNNVNRIIKEACIENYNQAVKAVQNGANRLELCFDLYHGGTTPSLGTVKMIKNRFNIPVNVIIRPRGGNFVYSQEEIFLMVYDIENLLKNTNADGIVIGCLTKDGKIDIDAMNVLIKTAKSINKNIHITFHMAFDDIKNINLHYKENIDLIIKLGCDHILTKGCNTKAIDGKDNIKKYVKYAGNRIVILPGGGVTKDNYKDLMEYTDCMEVHGTKIVGLLE